MTSRSAPGTLSVRTTGTQPGFNHPSFNSPGLLLRNARKFFVLAFAMVAFVLAAGVAHAQGTAQITGTISDPTGAVVPHATVTVTNEATGVSRTTTTNGQGLYDFTGLDNGKYDLKTQTSGFSNYQKRGIVVDVAAVLREDVSLQAGSAEQTVTVEATALQVQSESNEVSTLITGQQILQLATNGRNVYDVAALGTGVSSGTATAFNGVTAQGSNANYSFNGMRPGHNVWMIDGGEVYDRGSGGKLGVLPAPDMLDEFQVLSSNYPPDYGIGSGGTILMALKQGTKSFHGALWEFNRNDAFDAYNYFANHSQPKPELRLNIFGGTIGGPLFIPHVYNNARNKTFFFWGEEWRRYIAGANPSLVNTIDAADFPTTANESGGYLPYTLFGKETANPIVPYTTDPAEVAKITAAGLVPGGNFQTNGSGQALIPTSLFDSNAVLFLGTGAIPAPNAPNDQYTSSPKQPTYVREDVVRIDHNMTDKLHLLGSYIHDQMSQTIYPSMWSGDNYVTVGNIFANPSWAAVIKLTQTLSPTLLNETSFNINGNTINITPQGTYKQPAGWNAGSFYTGNNTDNRLPEVNIAAPVGQDYTTSNWPWKNAFLDYEVRDDLSKLVGRHALKFGASYMRMDKNQQLFGETQGNYGFKNGQYSGDAYVNFLLGFASSYSQLQSQPVDHYVNNTFSFYVNDDWHANRRLTLSAGVRYDALPQVYEKNNRVSNFNPAHYSAANAQSPDPATGDLDPSGPGVQTINGTPFYLNGIDLAGQNGVPPQLVANDYYTIQPRIGFAYNLSGDGRTALRGGMGIFYERVQGNDIYNVAPNEPFSSTASTNTVYFSTPTRNNQSGASATVPFPVQSLTVKDNYYPNPGTLQYSLGIQHELAPGIVATLQTVNTDGWDQDLEHEINDLPLGDIADRESVATGGNPNLFRPYEGYSNIVQYSNATNFNYYSLQAQIRMQQRHGVSAQFAYTWSHEIDIKSDDLQSNLSDPYNVSYDRGSGSFDRRHIFNANIIYDLPWFAHSNNGFQRTALGGWQFSDTTVAETGVPLTITYNGPDTLGLGGNTTNRPNVGGPVSMPKTVNQWFNTSAFTAPVAPWVAATPLSGFGNAGKDMVRGPGLLNFNMMVSKNFLLTSHEGPRLQLRAECFNVFNHTEFNGVDTGFADGNFGHVTSTVAYSERTFQFSGKFSF